MEISLLGLLLWCFHLEPLWAAGIFQHQLAAPTKTRTPKAKEWMPPSSASLASPFTWVPTPNMDKNDPEGSEAAVAFLYSGDSSRLSQANCTQRFEARDVGKASSPPLALHSSLRSAIETLTHATNFLNMVFQTNDIRESSVKEDVEWYHALVRSIMEGDSQVYRAMLTFDAHPVSSKPQLMLQATKENNEILLQDLSIYAESLRNLTWENEWYNFFRFQKSPTLFKRILSNDLKTLDTPKWSRGDSYVMDTDHIKWSPPFLECEDGKFLASWMVTLSSSFYGLKPDLKPEFKGVVRMDVKIRNIDINQCASGQGWFANTHQCDLNSTKCVPQENQGFILGRYLCPCKPGFYRLSRPFVSSRKRSSQYAGQYGTVDSGNLLECRPCQEGCTTCIDDMPCLIKEDWSLRAAILAFQAFCMLAVFLSMLISYHFRKSKRIRASGVILLETILFGSLLLYFPVFILYFKPSIFRCIVLRWVRMLGFAIVYGTITLKLYRVLKVFLSRTAQRVPYMTSGRVLKMLALILLLVLWFLAAWTVGMLENIEKNIPLVVRSQTTNGLQFYICDHDRWDYMMVVAEMLFLFWGSFLCYATRTVPSAFHEPRYMGIALHNELIISATFHVVRFLMVPSLHPDWTLLLFFIHTHITTTLTLALLFIPKLFQGLPLREQLAAEVYEDELDMRRSGSYLNSSITSAWSEHSLDPDDIRDELKKLYTQLEVHKTKKMTANNPHLQKKRSSKRGIGRSLMRRITEIPESMSRQCSKEERDGSSSRGTRSRSGSYKRRHLDSGSSSMKLKDDFSSKRKVAPSLKKSHSTYDHMRDVKENNLSARHDNCKEAPLLDSLMRKKLAKKASERSNSDCLDDSAPLVYKSASAHNLSANKKPLQPKPSPLQKSLSVATSAKEKALLLTSRAYLEERDRQTQEKKARAAEDSAMESKASGHTKITNVASNLVTKRRQRDDASEATAESLLEDSGSIEDATCLAEADSASTTAPPTPGESRMQKHVTYAPNRSYSEHISDSAGKRHQASKKTPPEPPVRQQSLGHSLERTDQALALTQSLKRDSKGSPTLGDVRPWESMESPAKSEAERSRKASEDAPLPSPVGLQRLASIAAEVCPWEVMEVPSKKDPQGSEMDSQNDSPEKQPQISIPKSSMKSLSLAIKAFNRSRIKASVKARRDSEESLRKTEKPKLAEIVSLSVGGTPRQQETSRSPEESRAKVPSRQASICPWDEEDIPPSPQKKSPSKAFEVCPSEMSQDGIMLGRAGSSEAMAPKSSGKISPVILEETKSQWESTWRSLDTDQNAEDKTSKYALMVPRTDKKKAAAYPWEVAEAIASSRETSTALPRDEPITDGYKKGASSKEALQSVSQEKVSSLHDSRDSKEIEKSPELPEVDQKKPKSMEIDKAQICPWETEEVSTSDKALICPWDVEEPPVEMSPVGDKDLFSKETSRTQRAVAVEKISDQVDSICPWESMELPAKTEDAKSMATCRTPEDGTNIRIVICPWEETSDDFLLMDQLDQDPGEESKGAERTKPRSPISEEISDIPSRKWDKEGSPQDSICPWENAGAEEANTEIAAKIPDLPKVVLKTSSSVESKKAAVCPWEAEDIEIDSKAAICPWEVTLAPSDRRTSAHDKGEASKRTGDIMATSPEMASSPRESICPWETMGAHDIPSETGTKSPDQSKVARRESSSTDSFKAEVCPWEIQETDSSTKADVCPWEEPESLLSKRSTSKGDRALERERTTPPKETEPFKATEKAISPQESVCPWETINPSEVFIKPEMSKAPSKKSESVESLRAEICPWEVTKSLPDKNALSISNQDSTCATPKPTEKLISPREEVCPWESTEVEEPSQSGGRSPASRKSDSIESLRAVVCPWETSEEDLSTVDVHQCTAEKAPLEKQQLSHDPVESPKGKTDRALRSPGAKKAGGEIAFKKMEKSKSHQDTVCAWGSMDFEKPSAKSTRSLDLFLVGYKKHDSVESLKAEICPWDFQEIHTRAEICPWEVYEGPPESDTSRKDKGRNSTDETDTRPMGWWKAMEKAGSPRESISHWDSIELLSGRSPVRSKAGSSKSDSVESLRAEVCPWEVEEEESDSKMPTSKTEPVLITKVVLKQDTSRALKGRRLSTSPDRKNAGGPGASRKIEKAHSHHELASKSTEELSIKQSSKSFDLSKVGSQKSDSTESLRAEVCPWESQEFESITKMEDFPWEPADVPLEKKLSRKYISRTSLADTKAARKGPRDTPRVLASSHSAGSLIKKSDSSESRRTEICPWEADSPEVPLKEEICPWETATGLVTETEKQATCTDRTEAPPAGEKTPQSKPEGLARHRPLCRTYPESMLPKGISKGPRATAAAKTGSDGAMADICPWDDPAADRKDYMAISKAFSEASLWGAGGHGSTLARGQRGDKPQAREAKSPRQAKSVASPWDSD
ncbi:PREDICTED: probable G-protein coupled receptor 179 [Gekko japonicus]|uniref:Probable G-protein coupled receptor 179 n=1 Tax=Gekko japonicus TaxID=146911 RepID=A0ABM1K2H8_GEKJA|nr:PREDICTED: probable G-protein coupled receptor 179 [Gekko japonicus]